jgi:hypothetical protein
MARAYSKTYHISKTFNAPLDFVYAWCTDFREDDSRMTGGKTRRHFLERTKDRIIWTVAYQDHGKKVEGFRVVWLQPPDAWKLDTCGDGRERGDYKLKARGKNKTMLDMTFKVSYDTKEEVEPRKTWEGDSMKSWDAYGRHLEKDYRASLKK